MTEEENDFSSFRLYRKLDNTDSKFCLFVFAAKKVKFYYLRKWHHAGRHRGVATQRSGSGWPLGDMLHKGNIIRHGS